MSGGSHTHEIAAANVWLIWWSEGGIVQDIAALFDYEDARKTVTAMKALHGRRSVQRRLITLDSLPLDVVEWRRKNIIPPA